MGGDMHGVVGRPKAWKNVRGQRNGLGRPAREGEGPVREIRAPCRAYLSTAGHEESCRNLGGPPSKAEYSAATDSA